MRPPPRHTRFSLASFLPILNCFDYIPADRARSARVGHSQSSRSAGQYSVPANRLGFHPIILMTAAPARHQYPQYVPRSSV